MAFIVGLTGGIGSGKTTVGELFASEGAGLVDTDEIARQLTAANQPAVEAIAARFGPQFVAEDGSLDRVRMRKLVFAQPSERKDLEAILHPLIRQESKRQIQESTQPYVVLVVPLLIESGDHGRALNRILVVDCEPQTQVNRVMQRSGLSRNEVLSIIAAQAPRELRLSEADDIIHNDSDLETLRAQVKPLHLFYLGLAAGGR